jgi:O-antigen/teichoic acid export membrane protein
VATGSGSDDDPRIETNDRRRSRRSLRIPAPRPIIGSLATAAVAQVALVVTGVVTARTLGPADRGYLALVILVPAILHGVGTLGLPRAVTYFVASDRANERPVVQAIRLPVLLQAVSLTALQIVVLWFVLADEPDRVRWAGVAVLPLITATLADQYGLALLQGQRRYAAFNILRTAGVVLYLGEVLVLLAVGRTELVAFALAWVVATALSGALTLTFALSGRRAARDVRKPAEVSRRALMRFALRGYLAWLSPIGTFRLDQALIGLLLAPEALGLYVVGLAFTNVPTFISRSIGFIAYPQVARATRARADESRRFLWLSIALSGAAVIALELLAGWLVPLFFGSEFDGAVPLTRILLLAAFFEGARHVLTSTSSGSGRPGLASIAELASWLFLVPAVMVLMPLWEETGVAAATAIAAAGSSLTLLILVRGSHADETGRAPAADRTE